MRKRRRTLKGQITARPKLTDTLANRLGWVVHAPPQKLDTATQSRIINKLDRQACRHRWRSNRHAIHSEGATTRAMRAKVGIAMTASTSVVRGESRRRQPNAASGSYYVLDFFRVKRSRPCYAARINPIRLKNRETALNHDLVKP